LANLWLYAYGWGTTDQLPGYYAGTFASSDVGWEKTTQYDIGADFSVWGGRVNFTFDWFLKNTTDLLFQKAIPDYHGGGSYWVNQGEVKNSGVEFSVNAFPVQGNTFSWETTFNAGYVKNEIVDLAGEEELLDAVFSDYGGAMQIMKPGYPLGSFYLYKWNRFDQEGANLYETSDGYLTNNATDQYITGQGNPAWTFGWNNTLVWKNWSANIFINAALGASRLNLVRYALASQSGTYRFINLREAYFNGWDKVENKAEALYPSHTNGDNKIYGNSDFWLENASFLKIRNISIAYQIPKAITKFVDISLSVSAQNVWTLTNYSGLDPEIYNSGQGIDFGAYPIPRTVTFGVKLTF
jgi:hypothetical protein